MKADKKEPFQGAPKGGPWSYTRRTREEVQKEMCDMFEGLKIRCALLSDLEPRNMIQMSGHIGKIGEKRGKISALISFSYSNSFIPSDR